jgi:hypothetical protein
VLAQLATSLPKASQWLNQPHFGDNSSIQVGVLRRASRVQGGFGLSCGQTQLKEQAPPEQDTDSSSATIVAVFRSKFRLSLRQTREAKLAEQVRREYFWTGNPRHQTTSRLPQCRAT